MRNCIWGLMLLVGSIALADEAEKPVVEISASDATTWRFCLQDPSEWKMPSNFSEEKRASWIATQQAAVRAQVKTEAEAAKLPTRELQLKSGSVPKDLKEKTMVSKYQIEVQKLRIQKAKDESNEARQIYYERIRQQRLPGQNA